MSLNQLLNPVKPLDAVFGKITAENISSDSIVILATEDGTDSYEAVSTQITLNNDPVLSNLILSSGEEAEKKNDPSSDNRYAVYRLEGQVSALVSVALPANSTLTIKTTGLNLVQDLQQISVNGSCLYGDKSGTLGPLLSAQAYGNTEATFTYKAFNALAIGEKLVFNFNVVYRRQAPIS